MLLVSGWLAVSQTIIPDAQEHFLTASTRRHTHLFGGLRLTPPVLTSHLRQQIELREATREAQRSAGEREETGEAIWIEINLDSDDRVDEVAKYLEKKSIPIVAKGPKTPVTPPTIIAIVWVSTLREISELEGVVHIEHIPDSAPGSSNQRTQPQPSAQSLAEKHGVHTQHTVGITGERIQIGN